jgi:hypothetical protein
MNGGNAAAIVLWIMIVVIIIILIVWISCECSKKNKTDIDIDVRVPRGGKAPPKRKIYRPPCPAPVTLEERIEESTATVAAGSNWADMEKPFADSRGGGDGMGMMSYESYGSGGVNASKHAAYGSNFPTEEDSAARFPRNPGTDSGPDSVCSPSGDSKHGYNLDVNHLMPASWRGGKKCGAESEDETQWAAYAPSKAAFDSYITTAGSARLAVNTRTPQARQIGLPNLVKDAVQGCGAGGAPVPIGTDAVLFNDSDLRQNAIYNSVGKFPEMAWC